MRLMTIEMKGVLLVLCVTWSSLLLPTHGTGNPPGHLEPLGSHMPPEEGVPMMGKFPSPWVFYEDFVKQSQPLVMRKVLLSGDIPAFQKWTDAYLSDIFGHVQVEVESGKKEDRENGSTWRMTLEKYISVYEKLNGYLVTDIPDSLKVDLTVPLTLQCGGFQNSLQTIIMWFSSGGTKSHLHNDNLDNINCVFDGTKELVLIDKKHADLIHANGWEEKEGYSRVNVDRVDMHEFPNLREVPWRKVVVNKGDCLFIPHRWFHQVHSLPGRNLALNFWFQHRMWYNTSECKDMDPYTAPPKPLVQFDFPNPIEEARSTLLESMEGKESVTKKDFYTLFGTDLKEYDEINECFEIIDEDKNNLLDWPELYKFDLDKMVKDYPVLFAGVDLELDEEEDEVGYDESDESDNSEPGENDFFNDKEQDLDSLEEQKDEEDFKKEMYYDKQKSNEFESETIDSFDGGIYIHHVKQEKVIVQVEKDSEKMKHEEL
ncbi:tRNA wybutosine-synthesizing protein 5-like [Pecten maximus]|uniref:tRNA wybutosine-synthesizing protein 5-like n=1 Tax=Pecten maximus TaxID=6579 RepID=UPI001458D286|nr:tRNA wybutosine-synthesizing protein 5-like [Pecten maximus]